MSATDQIAAAIADEVAKKVYAMLQDMPARVEKRLLTPDEAGKMIGRTKRAILQMHYKREILGGGIFGGRVMFDVKEMERWIEEQKER